MLSKATMAEIRRAATEEAMTQAATEEFTRIQTGGRIAGPINLSARRQRVQVMPEHAASSGAEAGTTYEISTVAGVGGDDGFVRLQTLNGRELPRWHRVTELTPAPPPAVPGTPPMYPTEKGRIEMTNAAAERFEDRVKQLAASGKPWDKAIEAAGHEDETGAKAYRLRGIGCAEAVSNTPVLTLSATVEAKAVSGADFNALVETFQSETNCTWAHAARTVGARFPRLAESR
jgi:hypothetical protein